MLELPGSNINIFKCVVHIDLSVDYILQSNFTYHIYQGIDHDSTPVLQNNIWSCHIDLINMS